MHDPAHKILEIFFGQKALYSTLKGTKIYIQCESDSFLACCYLTKTTIIHWYLYGTILKEKNTYKII
jgi:hypothetical protein